MRYLAWGRPVVLGLGGVVWLVTGTDPNATAPYTDVAPWERMPWLDQPEGVLPTEDEHRARGER